MQSVDETKYLKYFAKRRAKSVWSDMTFEIGNVYEDENDATIECKISNRDLSNITSDLLKYTDADNPLIEAIKNAEDNQISFDVVVSLQKNENVWKIKMDDNLKNAISGGAW